MWLHFPCGADGDIIRDERSPRPEAVKESGICSLKFVDTCLKHAGVDRAQNYGMLMTNAHMYV